MLTNGSTPVRGETVAKLKVAINDFGRIGRNFLRCWHGRKDSPLDVVVVNDRGGVKNASHLLKYDSMLGIFKADVKILDNETITVDGKPIKAVSSRDPLKLPWTELGIDIVIEWPRGLFLCRVISNGYYWSYWRSTRSFIQPAYSLYYHLAMKSCLVSILTSLISFGLPLLRKCTPCPESDSASGIECPRPPGMIDYDLALLFQPMLMIGISIGVDFYVIFPEWMLTVLLIILFVGKNQVASATSILAMLFSASMAMVEYYLLKRFPVPYVLCLVGVATVASVVGQYLVRKVVAILGRACVIIFILTFTLCVSAVLLGGVGVAHMIEKIER